VAVYPEMWFEDGRDPYYGEPLWLRVPVASYELWAYNARHLAFLKDYVAADHRRRDPNWNGSMVSRLPKWMKVRSMRPRVLAAIERLEARIAAHGG